MGIEKSMGVAGIFAGLLLLLYLYSKEDLAQNISFIQPKTDVEVSTVKEKGRILDMESRERQESLVEGEVSLVNGEVFIEKIATKNKNLSSKSSLGLYPEEDPLSDRIAAQLDYLPSENTSTSLSILVWGGLAKWGGVSLL